MSDLSPFQQMITRTYYTITFILGVAYGCYAYYVFLYLDLVCQLSHVKNPLDSLLFVLAVSMLFETIAEPLTGTFADIFGRRIACVIAYGSLTIGFLLYGFLAFSWTHRPLIVIPAAISAEFVLAVGLAFHSGSLDAWFVDAVQGANPTTDSTLEPMFARCSQVFTVALALGGSVAFWLGHAVTVNHQGGSPEAITIAEPWILAALLGIVAMAGAAAFMIENRAQPASDLITDDHDHQNEETESEETGAHLSASTWQHFWTLLKTPPMRRLLSVSSATYVIAMVFQYFIPLAVKRCELRDYQGVILPLLPVVLIAPRYLGPQLSLALAKRIRHVDQRLAVLGILAAACFGISGLMLTVKSLPFSIVALLLLTVSWMCIHGSRPTQVAYVNELVKDSRMRTFAISMTTPFGSAIVALIAFIMLGLQVSFEAISPLGVLLAIVGFASGVMVWHGTRN